MSAEASISGNIIYEQPLNEPMRICLRLEHLFSQLKRYSNLSDTESSQHALTSIVKLIDVINRPDLKSKLSQTLSQLASSLGQLERFPQVDPSRLSNLLLKLDSLIVNFHHQKTRVAERLRNNEFLNQIRLRQANPGGACIYSMPALALWLKNPPEKRANDLSIWDSEFSELRQIIDLILYLTRNSNEAQVCKAENGFYHQNLDPLLPCEIIRINVPTHYNVFPEFSVGRHRLSIRFLIPNYQEKGRPTQSREGFSFELTCCRV